jgi:hypothetical protein
VTFTPTARAETTDVSSGLERLGSDVSQLLAGDAWAHTLWGGSVSSIVGAAVALLVVLLTVRAQNREIARQLAAQARGIEDQLAEQRRGNTKNREHEAAAVLLSALQSQHCTGGPGDRMRMATYHLDYG